MAITETVRQHEAGYWVVEIDYDGLQSVYQDVDFERGGRIASETRANELLTTIQEKRLAKESVPSVEQEVMALMNRLSEVEKGVGAGGKISESGMAKRIDDIESRLSALEGN